MSLIKALKNEREIIIYGAGVIARGVVKTFSRDIRRKIKCIAVSSTNNNVKELENIPVCAVDVAIKEYPDAYIIVAARERYWADIRKTLDSFCVKKYAYIGSAECIHSLEDKWKRDYPELYKIFEEKDLRRELNDEDYIFFLSKQINEDVLNFEVNLVDHCNLNCQCCNHFSPIAEKTFLNCDEYEKDIRRVAELYGNRIGKLMLLGGEPLLHPEIIRIMIISRSYLPNEDIVIVSNGLLLPQMESAFWQTCFEWKIGILLTKYPINFDYFAIEEIAKKYNVSISYTYESQELKTTYHLPLRLDGKLNPQKNYMKCNHANNCVVLRDGRLYTCPLAACVHHFNKYFTASIPEKDVNSISIHQDVSKEEIDLFLKKPIPMCEFCDIYGYEYDLEWKTSKRKIEEWT